MSSNLQLSPEMAAARARSAESLVLWLFFGMSVAWLGVVTLLGLITSIQMHMPAFLNVGLGCFSYGRLEAVYRSALVYGWLCNAGLGLFFWMLLQSTRAPLLGLRRLVIGGVLWNASLAMGAVGILFGWGAGIAWLEIPPYAAAIALLGFLMMGSGILDQVHARSTGRLQPAHAYGVAAVFCFAWLALLAAGGLGTGSLRGVMQAIVTEQYAHGLVWLCVVPLALSVAYHFMPRLTGQPIGRPELASFGFWTWMLFAAWAGLAGLTVGPLPVWLISVGVVAGVLMVVPIVIVAVNLFGTLRGQATHVYETPALRFLLAGVIMLTIAAGLLSVFSLRSVQAVMGTTCGQAGLLHWLLYGGCGFIFFGAIYALLPHMTGKNWPQVQRIKAHFWTSVYGSGLVGFVLAIGGMSQGMALQEAHLPFEETLLRVLPYLTGQTLGWFLIFIGNGGFFHNVAEMIGREWVATCALHARRIWNSVHWPNASTQTVKREEAR